MYYLCILINNADSTATQGDPTTGPSTDRGLIGLIELDPARVAPATAATITAMSTVTRAITTIGRVSRLTVARGAEVGYVSGDKASKARRAAWRRGCNSGSASFQ